MSDCFDGPGCELICVALCIRKMNHIPKEGRKYQPLFLVLDRTVMKSKDLGRCVVHMDGVDIIVHESRIFLVVVVIYFFCGL